MNIDQEKQKWLGWFGNLGSSQAEKQFETWRHLFHRYAQLKALVEDSKLDLSSVRSDLEVAHSKLKYDKPYRVVVIGESGAGKSTLINAILQDDLLPREAGGAITGTSIHIHLNSSVSEDQVSFAWRSDEDFQSLLQALATRYKVKLAKETTDITPQLIFSLLNDQALTPPEDVPARIREKLPEELRSIAITWNQVHSKRLTLAPGMSLSQRKELDEVLNESSAVNKDERTRVISALKHAEYWLSPRSGTLSNARLKHIELVDTPGIGATILRHEEILRQEIDQADVAVIVVGARRPGAYAEEMAHLVKQVLLEGYSTEKRDEFASKVFLVVNQADALLEGKGNRTPLEQSVSQICKIIAPDFEKRYGKDSKTCRYFETTALLSLLSTQKLKGKPLSDSDNNLYSSRTQLFGEDANTADPAYIDQLSQVPALTTQLSRFLSEQRVDLTLAEAEDVLDRIQEKIWSIGQQILKKHGIEVEKGQLTDAEDQHHVYFQGICKTILEQDYQILIDKKDELVTEMDRWWRSPQHQREITSRVQSIFDNLKSRMDVHLAELLDPNSKRGIVRKARDDANGKNHQGIVPEEVLLDAQWLFHKAVEVKSQDLAGYYVHKLETEITAQQIHRLLEEKGHEMTYAKSLNSVSEMQAEMQRIRKEFESTCKWILVYELIKMPILLPPDPAGDNEAVRRAFERAIETVRESAPDLTRVGAVAIRAIANHMVPPPLQEFVDVVAEVAGKAIEAAVEPQPKNNSAPDAAAVPIKHPAIVQTNQLLDIEQLKSTIDRLMADDNREEVSKLIQKQFSLRYNLAIGAALLFVEKLFFYLLGQYRRKLENESWKLIESHKNYLGAGNTEIQNRLLAQHTDQQQEVDRALACLKQLENLGKTEANSQPASQAA